MQNLLITLFKQTFNIFNFIFLILSFIPISLYLYGADPVSIIGSIFVLAVAFIVMHLSSSENRNTNLIYKLYIIFNPKDNYFFIYKNKVNIYITKKGTLLHGTRVINDGYFGSNPIDGARRRIDSYYENIDRKKQERIIAIERIEMEKNKYKKINKEKKKNIVNFDKII